MSKPLTSLAATTMALFLGAGVAHAFATADCLAQKQKAWGALRKCEAGEKVKLLRAKPADLARCQTKFNDTLEKISTQAASVSVPCRYGANGDGTVTDYDTGLQWEQKDTAVGSGSNYGDPHAADNVYYLSLTGTPGDGSAFTDFLAKLNTSTDDGTDPPTGLTGGFAGHSDWRFPSILELEGIVDMSAGSPAIDPIFGPTVADFSWSVTTVSSLPGYAWTVHFAGGDVGLANENNLFVVRAVRPVL